MSKFPQPQSATQRAVRFFTENPGESLTVEDMAVKFDISVSSARNLTQELLRRGLVEWVHLVQAKAAPE